VIRPTRRATLLFAALLPVPWLLLVFHPEWWPFAFDASLLVVVAIGADAVRLYPRRALTVDLTVGETGFVGEPVRVTVALHYARPHPPGFEMTIDASGDVAPAFADERMHVAAEARSASSDIVPARRGMLFTDAVWLRWRGPLGFVQRTVRFSFDRRTRIVPSVHASRSSAFELFTRDAILGAKDQRGKGEGSEFEALREYAHGDDIRFVDWKHSARHRTLLLREFRTERNHPIVLAFDTGHLMREPVDGLSRIDHAIHAGLLLAWMALRSGDLVGTYSFDSRPGAFAPPARGAGRFRYLQQRSAELAYSTDETNFTLGLTTLYGALDRRSLIVLFTEFIDTVTAELLIENARRLARRHLVVFVALGDAAASDPFAGAPGSLRGVARTIVANDVLQDRKIVLERLRRLGVQCIDVAPDRLSPALINRYLTIKQRDLL
jgi:uncharacterized protein (DUF58 family)